MIPVFFSWKLCCLWSYLTSVSLPPSTKQSMCVLCFQMSKPLWITILEAKDLQKGNTGIFGYYLGKSSLNLKYIFLFLLLDTCFDVLSSLLLFSLFWCCDSLYIMLHDSLFIMLCDSHYHALIPISLCCDSLFIMLRFCCNFLLLRFCFYYVAILFLLCCDSLFIKFWFTLNNVVIFFLLCFFMMLRFLFILM